MSHVFLIVEGQSEEKFYKSVFAEHFNGIHTFEVTVMPKKKNSYSRKDKGGSIKYETCLTNLARFAHSTTHCDYFVLIYDYYGLSDTFFAEYTGDNSLDSKLNYVRERLNNDVHNPRFKLFLQVHEFEAFLFSKPDEIPIHYNRRDLIDRFNRVLRQFNNNPETINNSESTAPSKRIISYFPEYEYGKISDGVVIAKNIGIPTILDSCPRFRAFCESL